jgi:hypothetical protein
VTKNKYSYDRFGSQGQRVGQAVLDLYDNHQSTVEEVLYDMELGEGYRQTILDEFTRSKGHYPDKYFILSLTKHALGEMGVNTVYKTSARSFVYPLKKEDVLNVHPNCMKVLYSVDATTEDIRLAWCVPGWEECKSILKQPKLYDPNLVKWVKEALGRDHSG